MIEYNDLPDGAKDVIQTVKQRFADMFDSDSREPFATEMNGIGDNRMAVLLDISLGNIMLYVMLPMNWTVETYPYAKPICRHAAILALTIELIMHLMRSYVEFPDTSRLGAPDVIRRDYLTRWQTVLKDYQEQLKQAMKRMNSELYTDQMESGAFQSVLIDYPSTTNWGWPVGYAEKEHYGAWW